MSATNLTKNLKLPQFVASDKPSWLGDVNGAMLNIDNGIGEIKGDISKANDTASSAKSQSDANTVTLGNVNTELESIGNRVTSLEAGGGTEQLEQKVNTNTSDIEALQTRADTFEEEIADNGSKITTLTTTITSNTNDINTLKNNITSLQSVTQGNSESIQTLTTVTSSNTQAINTLSATVGNVATLVNFRHEVGGSGNLIIGRCDGLNPSGTEEAVFPIFNTNPVPYTRQKTVSDCLLLTMANGLTFSCMPMFSCVGNPLRLKDLVMTNANYSYYSSTSLTTNGYSHTANMFLFYEPSSNKTFVCFAKLSETAVVPDTYTAFTETNRPVINGVWSCTAFKSSLN